jgi:hypothetical protein
MRKGRALGCWSRTPTSRTMKWCHETRARRERSAFPAVLSPSERSPRSGAGKAGIARRRSESDPPSIGSPIGTSTPISSASRRPSSSFAKLGAKSESVKRRSRQGRRPIRRDTRRPRPPSSSVSDGAFRPHCEPQPSYPGESCLVTDLPGCSPLQRVYGFCAGQKSGVPGAGNVLKGGESAPPPGALSTARTGWATSA